MRQSDKDTVLFALLRCAVHPRQSSSDTAEQLQTNSEMLWSLRFVYSIGLASLFYD